MRRPPPAFGSGWRRSRGMWEMVGARGVGPTEPTSSTSAGSGVRAPAHALELAPEALARPALPPYEHDHWPNPRHDRRAVVHKAGRGDGGPDTRLDRPHDLDDALAIGDERFNPIARTYLRRRLRRRSIHEDVAALAQRVASGRVFTRRTAHNQRSTRVASVARGSVTRSRMARGKWSRRADSARWSHRPLMTLDSARRAVESSRDDELTLGLPLHRRAVLHGGKFTLSFCVHRPSPSVSVLQQPCPARRSVRPRAGGTARSMPPLPPVGAGRGCRSARARPSPW